jgi:hypothetical protein
MDCFLAVTAGSIEVRIQAQQWRAVGKDPDREPDPGVWHDAVADALANIDSMSAAADAYEEMWVETRWVSEPVPIDHAATDRRIASPAVRACRLQLMDSGLGFAPRMRAELQSTVEDVAKFALPTWIDQTGRLRVALPVCDPQHATDILQLIVPLAELLSAIGTALAHKAATDA